MIQVRFATSDDEAALLRFIHDHWSAQHVFVQHPEVFRWQHLQGDGRLNMVFAEDTESDDPILGVLGFISLGRFDPTLGDRDVMLAIWKVRDEGVPPGVGLRLLKFLQAQLQPRLIAAIGTSQMVRPIYQALRYEVGALEHAALFHPDRQAMLRVAADVPDDAFRIVHVDGPSVELRSLDEVSTDRIDWLARSGEPVKSLAYLVERYVRHPWYEYQVRLAVSDGEPVAAVVWRRVEAEATAVLRIVDVVGPSDWIRAAGAAFRREVVAADAEYIDIMHWGIDDQTLAAAGFVSRGRYPEMVLPNYFEPFERRNVEIELAFRVFGDGAVPGVRLFRADSDQDRPNRFTETD